MKQKKSPEHKVRIKIGLILLVIILYFTGLFIYSYSLKKNMDLQKVELDNSHAVLSKSNQLIVSIQQAQDVLNTYLTSPRRALQQQYDSISSDISLQIIDIKNMKPEKEQDVLLQDIDSLLQEKNRIVRKLTGLFRSQNPLTELDQKIDRYDQIIRDSVMVITNTDTTKIEKHRKGFWNRLRNVFDPEYTPDTTISITRIEKETRPASSVDTTIYADLKKITEEASKSYSSHIQGIEREVQELLFAEQNISLHISQLTNDFYNEAIQISWKGTVNSKNLTQEIFRFAIVIGALSILFILVIIFFIIDDLNKGQKARTDLAKEKQFTEELMESRHKLLLSVSHDVKTPLSSMMGYMEMWDSEETDSNKKRQLQSARSSGKHILNMLTNLLDFSRLQQKTVSLHLSRFNLIELVEEVIHMFRPLTYEKALSLTLENLAATPLYIETDKMLLKQILTNVISNAVKYTIKGGIIVRLQHDRQLVFTITDTGIGMDADELPEIFKPFSRMESPLNVEGTGFGMYVTKGLIDLLNGKIEVASEKGKGTCVTISLPFPQTAGQTGDPALSGDKPIQPAGKIEQPAGIVAQPIPKIEQAEDNSAQVGKQFNKVLIFEDNPSLGNMIKEYLVRNKFKVKLCGNSCDVNGFLRVISMFDIVITDMQMTGITGTDILHEIRKTDSQIPVWLMTAHDDYTSERALSEGFSGLIRKPIQMSDLTDILSSKKTELNEDTCMTGRGDMPEESKPFPEEEENELFSQREESKLSQQGGKNKLSPPRENNKPHPKGKENDLRKDFPKLSALFQGDVQTIEDILSAFVESANKDMDNLSALIEEGNFEKTQQLSHKIHPFFSQLDADSLCTALRKMDSLRGEKEEAYPGWKEDLEKTISEIRQFTIDIKNKYL